MPTNKLKIRDISKEREHHTTCEYCKTENADLRPYGLDGAWICYLCAMKPENKATTDKMFKANLDGSDIVITG